MVFLVMRLRQIKGFGIMGWHTVNAICSLSKEQKELIDKFVPNLSIFRWRFTDP